MPPASLEAILKHAFKKGSGRVGRSTTQTEERKAKNAVGAHIRHTHTSYDALCDAKGREKARQLVRQEVQAIQAQWCLPVKVVPPSNPQSTKKSSNILVDRPRSSRSTQQAQDGDEDEEEWSNPLSGIKDHHIATLPRSVHLSEGGNAQTTPGHSIQRFVKQQVQKYLFNPNMRRPPEELFKLSRALRQCPQEEQDFKNLVRRVICGLEWQQENSQARATIRRYGRRTQEDLTSEQLHRLKCSRERSPKPKASFKSGKNGHRGSLSTVET